MDEKMISFTSNPVTIPFVIWLVTPLAAFGTFLFIRGGFRWQTLKNLRGPPTGSWLCGHQVEFYHQKDVGELDFKWASTYGGAWKIDGCFGSNILMISDPGAIRHIIHTMCYGYPKTRSFKTYAGFALGRGVVWAGGDTHVRHRKLLNPVFTAQAIRPFLHIFRRVGAQLTNQWRDKLQDGNCSEFQIMDIRQDLIHATLDIIGEAVFDYHFGALDSKGDNNELSEVLHNLFSDSNLFPPKGAILFAASWAYWPDFALRYVGILPFRQFVRFKKFLATGKRLGKELLEKHLDILNSEGKKQSNILTILAEANRNNNKADRLSEDEILSQITTLLFAGHDTTASTMAMIIYELARNPEDQVRVREEINAKRLDIAAKGQRDFTSTDLESLAYTNAVIKEGLRMHPIEPWIIREAAVADVIPLSEPVIGIDGKTTSEIKVVPGQHVFLSTCAYNRHSSTWGADSHQWRPSRHLDGERKDKQISLGLYSNLLSFSGGPSGCIGWRFALGEILAICVELLESFEFSAAPDDIKMLRTPVGGLMQPMVEGRLAEGSQMPLGVRPF